MCPSKCGHYIEPRLCCVPAPTATASLNFIAQFIWTMRSGVCGYGQGELWWILYLSGNHIGNIDPNKNMSRTFLVGQGCSFCFPFDSQGRGRGSRKKPLVVFFK